jgi:hypothetical protein
MQSCTTAAGTAADDAVVATMILPAFAAPKSHNLALRQLLCIITWEADKLTVHHPNQCLKTFLLATKGKAKSQKQTPNP